jgi:hypothetical protein
MSHTLTLKAFFFNATTDYLPYYKNFTIILNETSTAKDLLASIQAQNSDFSYPSNKLIIKINGFIVEGHASISSIVEALGSTLIIDPANSYRANNGLEINDKEFLQSFALLAPYASDEDLAYYESLYALHYASETEKYAHDYIGDAILVLAYKMISEGTPNKEAILEAITSPDTGLLSCEYENNLFASNGYASEIEALKAMLNEEENKTPSLCTRLKKRFCKTKVRIAKIIEKLEDKNIAYHSGLDTSKQRIISQMLIDIDAKEIAITRQKNLLGLSILKTDKILALKKAGTTLLDAYDAGTQVLIIEDKASYEMCTKHFKAIENTMGRKMIDLELLFVEDFIAQVSLEEA